MPEYEPFPNCPKPSTVVHADWSLNRHKRWMVEAVLKSDGRYSVSAPTPVGDTSTLLDRVRSSAGPDTAVLVGFDFPMGVPARYAELAGIESFLSLVPKLGEQEWSNFYAVAERPDQINAHRPFYPQRPGGTAMVYLLDALGVQATDELLRRCDRGYPGRPAAAPLFWTMGPKQVGKAAISGWRDLLAPALRSPDLHVAVWPFDGELHELLRSGSTVIVETYPAEFYRHLGIKLGSKRNQDDRQENAPTLLRWVDETAVDLTPEMTTALREGFGPTSDGEDPFDATIGLFGMLNVVFGRRSPGEPVDTITRQIEGWMLGQLQSATEPEANNSRLPVEEVAVVPTAESSTEYDPMADLYDLEYDHDYDVPFWLTLAGREAGPVVEWGAGTGRIAVPLAAAGHDVTAVELSTEMVERGRGKGGAVEWIVGDMRSAELGLRYGLAVCGFNSFSCLLDGDGALAFLGNAREHLLPGGLLGVEVSAFSPEELADPQGGPQLRHDFTRDLPDGRLDRFSVSRYDAASQLMRMSLFYDRFSDSGALQSRRAHDLTIRIVGRGELESMLRLSGFEVEAVYGGFEGEPFTAASDHLIVLARRT